jgi:hypothetical protein
VIIHNPRSSAPDNRYAQEITLSDYIIGCQIRLRERKYNHTDPRTRSFISICRNLTEAPTEERTHRPMNTRDALAEAFRKLSEIGERFGPHLISRSGTDDEKQFRELSEASKPLFLKAAQEHERINDRVVRVRSAYHALLILRQLEESFHSRGARFRPLFRGQAHPYDPLPSLFRPDIDRIVETRSSEIFCALLEYLLNGGGKASQSVRTSYLAIAQHYGIRTPLLDFTPDPDVAVYFAAKDPPRKPGGEAVVYYIPFNNVWDAGCRIYLVPAFAERVYLQRGVFVQIPEAEVKTFRSRCFEIRFPHDPDFQVLRYGKPVNILQEDRWLANAIAWTRQRVARSEWVPEDEEEQRRFWDTCLTELDLPPFTNRAGEMLALAQWVDNISDLLYWLVISVGEKEAFDPSAMDIIARDNPATLKDFVQIFEAEGRRFKRLGQRERAKGRRAVCKLIRSSIRSATKKGSK